MARRRGPTCKHPLHRKFFEAARAQGWSVEHTGSSHIVFTPPDKTKPKVYIPSTPSDPRSLLNSRSDLRRAGLKV